jgi:EmrB/QacA subfamily drug resistance transporter
MTHVDSLTTNRRFVLVCVIIAMFMSAVEATIVATAMPRIIADVGGFSLYAWVFSVFLMAQAATTVTYGRLADTFGRRPTLIVGLTVFLAGSVMCGFAWSMPSLILFRAIQGIGAGSIQPIANTIIGDHYAPEERATIQGYLGSVWGIAAIIGPLIGSIIVQQISWSWIFWLNIPFCLLTIVGLSLFLREKIAPKRHAIDYLGAVLFTIMIIAVLMVLTPGHSDILAQTPSRIALTLVFLLSAALFVLQEQRAPEPMISFDFWSDPLVASANGATLIAGMLVIGMTSLLPIYVQGVLSRSPLVAGMTLTTLSIGWPLASIVASRLYRWLSPRNTLRLGGLIIFCGGLIFPWLGLSDGVALAATGGLVLGFGIGLLITTSIILVQSSVDWSRRGSATASNVFARILGSTLGASILGAVMNFGIARAASNGGSAATFDTIRELLDQPVGADASTPAQHALQQILFSGLHLTFWAISFLALMTFLIALLVPAREFGEQRKT